EVVQRFCSKISSTNRYGKKIREKLASYLDEMAVKLGEKALPRLQRSLQMQNKEDLQRFDLIVTEVLGEVLAQDFKQLQSEVLLRRTIEPDTLLGRIREGR
ncbi:MAG TPA: hypothetical protein VJC11_02375, partial [Patescibacteria group bacterium]|nr:hypothetical protein [Patescibacteria group bacterium]